MKKNNENNSKEYLHQKLFFDKDAIKRPAIMVDFQVLYKTCFKDAFRRS